MAARTHKFQAPKGTRDFYPDEMAVRRYVEAAWRQASIDHGFDEIEGPTFEHLELYTVKSGPGIVSELFSFRRSGGETDYALRPEFTPTLARMYAGAARTLPKPTKWFGIPSHFRAERPQRGRLREFYQWNVDVVGDESPRADAEVIAVAITALERLGLTSEMVQVRLNDRHAIAHMLEDLGVAPAAQPEALALLDRRDRIDEETFAGQAADLGLAGAELSRLTEFVSETFAVGDEGKMLDRWPRIEPGTRARLETLGRTIEAFGLSSWCHWDPGIVRGLAYYTGTVFEVHETSGRERAVAGGGRYDGLVEMFGGPATPAVGFGMGDVVLRLLLEDRGLLEAAESYLPRPDVFAISGLEDADEQMHRLVADLRRRGLHVRHSYRTTRNIGKLLGEANRSGARHALILGQELEAGEVVLKDLASGEQRNVALTDAVEALGAVRPTTDRADERGDE